MNGWRLLALLLIGAAMWVGIFFFFKFVAVVTGLGHVAGQALR